MRVLVTRPREDAERLAEPLRALGASVVNEPLLMIVPVAGPSLELADVQAVLVTSANGARALAKATERRDIPIFAVGDQSGRAARDLGFKRVESAGGDVNTLARLVSAGLDPAAGPLLHAAGSVQAGDLAGQLRPLGFEVRVVPLYDARPTAALSASVRQGLAEGAFDAGFFYSPRTARTFVAHARKANLSLPLPGMMGYALSQAVADALEPVLPPDRLRVAEQPTQDAMLAIFQADVKEGTLKPPEPTTPESSSDHGDTPPESDRTETGTTDDSAAPTSDRDHDQSEAAHDAHRHGDDDEAAYAGSTGDEATGHDDGDRDSDADHAERRTMRQIVRWFVILVVLVAAGFGSMPWWWHQVPQPFQSWLPDLPAAPEPPGVAALRGEVDGLTGRVGDLSGTVDGLAGDVEALASRLDQADPGEASDQAAALADTVAALRDRVQALESRPVALVPAGGGEGEGEGAPAQVMMPSVDPARVDSLEADLAAVSEGLATLRDRLDAMEAAQTADTGARDVARVLAIGQLRRKIESGSGYGDALAALEAIGIAEDGADALATLSEYSDQGVPTLTMLRLTYEDVSRAAARRVVVPEGEGWFTDTVSSLMDSVTVRRKGEVIAGGGLDALATAEARLDEADLEGAITALETLEGDPAKELSDWLADARARASVDTALSALTTAALERLGAAEKTE
jgi:uroporphyrinogen-III synthase